MCQALFRALVIEQWTKTPVLRKLTFMWGKPDSRESKISKI